MSTDLGIQIAVYHPSGSTAGRIAAWLAVVVGMVAAGAAGLWGAWQTYLAYYYHGPAAVLPMLVPWLALALLAGCIGLVALRPAVARIGPEIRLHECGLLIRSRTSEEIWPWTGLASLRVKLDRQQFLGIPLATRRTLLMTRLTGERFEIGGQVRDAKTLIESIRERAVPILYARYSEVYTRGGDLAFGPLQLRQGGLALGDRYLAWETIQEVGVHSGKLQITAREGIPITIPAGNVPNPDVLVALAEDRLKR